MLIYIKTSQKRASDETKRILENAFSNQRAEFNSQLLPLNETFLRQVNESKDSALKLNSLLNDQMLKIREDNERKLENIQRTVDEKLQVTLEKRIGTSFEIVNKQLTNVSEGLGQMKSLMDGVDNLNAILQNVKKRGNWGEAQLFALVEDILAPSMWVKNFAADNSLNRVELAIKLPSKTSDDYIYLPIDSKFPLNAYHRFLEAEKSSDINQMEVAKKELRSSVLKEAASIQSKYVIPPKTTDFAIMYLPSESLFAQVLQLDGLLDETQKKFKVTISGPTTLHALLNSLQLGFRTLTIEKKTDEVFTTLSIAKSKFEEFNAEISRAKNQTVTVLNTFEMIERKQRAINRSLKDLEV